MPLRDLDFSQMPSPIARFRDVAQERYGLELPGMAPAFYAAIGLRQVYQETLGPFTPAQVEVIHRGTVTRPGVVVHKLLCSSHRDNWAPANLFLPAGQNAPATCWRRIRASCWAATPSMAC